MDYTKLLYKVGIYMAELSSEELEKIVKEEDNSIKPMKEFESPEKLYQELIASVRKYHPSTDISLSYALLGHDDGHHTHALGLLTSLIARHTAAESGSHSEENQQTSAGSATIKPSAKEALGVVVRSGRMLKNENVPSLKYFRLRSSANRANRTGILDQTAARSNQPWAKLVLTVSASPQPDAGARAIEECRINSSRRECFVLGI